MERSCQVPGPCSEVCRWEIWLLIPGLLIPNCTTLKQKPYGTKKVSWCFSKMKELGKILCESPFSSKILCWNEAMANTWSKLYEIRGEMDVSSVWPHVSAAQHLESCYLILCCLSSLGSIDAFPNDFHFSGLIWVSLLRAYRRNMNTRNRCIWTSKLTIQESFGSSKWTVHTRGRCVGALGIKNIRVFKFEASLVEKHYDCSIG